MVKLVNLRNLPKLRKLRSLRKNVKWWRGWSRSNRNSSRKKLNSPKMRWRSTRYQTNKLRRHQKSSVQPAKKPVICTNTGKSLSFNSDMLAQAKFYTTAIVRHVTVKSKVWATKKPPIKVIIKFKPMILMKRQRKRPSSPTKNLMIGRIQRRSLSLKNLA